MFATVFKHSLTPVTAPVAPPMGKVAARVAAKKAEAAARVTKAEKEEETAADKKLKSKFGGSKVQLEAMKAGMKRMKKKHAAKADAGPEDEDTDEEEDSEGDADSGPKVQTFSPILKKDKTGIAGAMAPKYLGPAMDINQAMMNQAMGVMPAMAIPGAQPAMMNYNTLPMMAKKKRVMADQSTTSLSMWGTGWAPARSTVLGGF